MSTESFSRRMVVAILVMVLAMIAIAVASALSTPAQAAPMRSYSPPKNQAPILPQFTQSPWVYGWQKVYTYKIKLPNTATQTMYGHVVFSSYLESKNKGGGGYSATRNFTLKAGETKTITTHFMTPQAQPEGNFYSWCIEADVYAEGMPFQSTTTCASFDTGK